MSPERPIDQQPMTDITRDDLAQLYRLVRQVFTRMPSRELRKAIQLLEPYLPESERSSTAPHVGDNN